MEFFIAIVALFSVHTVYADNPHTYQEIAQFIAAEAQLSGVDPKIALYIADNESKLGIGQSRYLDPTGPNGREDSWGVWQIHLSAHKDITRAQAQDIFWSTEWAMQQLKNGNCKIWTECPLPKG